MIGSLFAGTEESPGETVLFEGRRVMRVCMDTSGPEGKLLKMGDVIYARVGIQDRAITFTSEYLGEGSFPVTNSLAINCVYLGFTKLPLQQKELILHQITYP